MGWSEFHRPDSKSVKDTIISQFEGENDFKWEVLDIHVGRNVAYLAVKRTPITEAGKALQAKHPEQTYVVAEDGSYVLAGVALFTSKKTGYYNFGIKTMSETMGPNDRSCPARILNLLSDFQSDEAASYALKWRADCRENLKTNPVKKAKRAALTTGAIIRFDTPLTFQRGMGTYDTFMVERDGRAYRFHPLDGMGKALFRCRITKFADRPHVVMTREEAFPYMKEAA